ncbi:MAG: tetratricopeptide repeat protein, partial [Chitinophagaceae bacterium]
MKYFFLILFFLGCFFQLIAQGDATDLYNKARALKKERKCYEAIPVLLKVLELKPSNTKALNDIGWCYNETKQFDKAIPQLQK